MKRLFLLQKWFPIGQPEKGAVWAIASVLLYYIVYLNRAVIWAAGGFTWFGYPGGTADQRTKWWWHVTEGWNFGEAAWENRRGILVEPNVMNQNTLVHNILSSARDKYIQLWGPTAGGLLLSALAFVGGNLERLWPEVSGGKNRRIWMSVPSWSWHGAHHIYKRVLTLTLIKMLELHSTEKSTGRTEVMLRF